MPSLPLTGAGPSAAGWTPADIADLKVWLDAGTITGLSDGDAVTTWTDLSGNSNSPTQATAGKRPLYKTSIINSLPVVRGDGSDDYLAKTFGSALSQPNTVFIVCKWIALGTGDYRFVCDAPTGTRHALYRKPAASSKWGFYAGSLGDTDDAVDTSAHYLVAVFNGASSSLRLDGVEIDTSNIGTQTMGGAILFTADALTGTYCSNVDIAEYGVYDAGLSAGNIGLLETYLSAKYGI